MEGLNRQNFSDLLPAKQFCCRPGQLLIICAGGVGLRKSKMSSWRQGDDEKASMQGPVPTVQRNGDRRFATAVSEHLLYLRLPQPPKYHTGRHSSKIYAVHWGTLLHPLSGAVAATLGASLLRSVTCVAVRALVRSRAIVSSTLTYANGGVNRQGRRQGIMLQCCCR